MARLTRWLKQDYDGVVTLAVVVVAIVLELLNVISGSPPISTAVTDQAVLVVLGLLAFSILRDRRRERDAAGESQAVRLLNGVEIRRELEEARRGTDHWWFKGGTGTYLRAVTLPQCVQNAEREQRHLRIQIEIIAPTNEALCDYYARFRHARPDGTGEPWSRERARNEAYATILAACWYMQRYTFLRIEVALSETVPTFRWDLSSSCVIMTQELNGPHVMFKAPSTHYHLYTRELDSSFKQARRIPLELATHVRLSQEPTVGEARCLFGALDLELPVAMSDDAVADVVHRALHARNPYP
jgi:hypothetical protein